MSTTTWPTWAGELSIADVARITGVTSRTLRHYDALGLLRPSRVGAGGLRHYGGAELVRLQRILLLRSLGLPLEEIRRVLGGEQDEVAALRRHLDQLRTEQQRLARQAVSVERTITAMTTGEPIMAEEMFDGFDHAQHREEVEQRWGKDAYATADRWWRGMSDGERAAWTSRAQGLGGDWTAAAASGVAPDSPEGQELARRHVEWLASMPGTPGHGGTPVKEYVTGLADLYVADPRFAANYGGQAGATFVRDALHAYADRHL